METLTWIPCSFYTFAIFYLLILLSVKIFNRKYPDYYDTNKPVTFLRSFGLIAAAIIVGPAHEEILFRSWLIILCREVPEIKWYALTASSAVFSYCHWKNGVHKIMRPGDKTAQKMSTLMSFIYGMIIGYFGIKFESIWLAFGIHALINCIPIGFTIVCVWQANRA